MEAHSLFLQAAGMPAETVHALTDCETVRDLSERQKALVEFANKLTRSPQTFALADTDALRQKLPDQGEVVEAATVVAGFNFANRVADAIAVPREVPEIFQQHRRLRHTVMGLMGLGIRLRMNFKNRTLQSPPPDLVLGRLKEETRRAGMGRLPSYFEKLRIRPHILAGQAAICRSLLSNPGFSRETILRIGFLISTLNHDWECARECCGLLAEAHIPVEPIQLIVAGKSTDSWLPTLEEEILLFVRDVTLQAWEITDAQVASLQRQGLSDLQILNLVLISASYNAGNRLNRALGEPEEYPLSDLDYVRLPDHTWSEI